MINWQNTNGAPTRKNRIFKGDIPFNETTNLGTSTLETKLYGHNLNPNCTQLSESIAKDKTNSIRVTSAERSLTNE